MKMHLFLLMTAQCLATVECPIAFHTCKTDSFMLVYMPSISLLFIKSFITIATPVRKLVRVNRFVFPEATPRLKWFLAQVTN